MLISERKNKIKFLLWSYLLLLIFEGALRKWFLPFLSTPLLLVRDPIALLALFWAWPLLVRSIYWLRVQILLYIGLVGVILALYVGHGDWFTALYGLRIYWIQLPLVFVFPLVLTREDVFRALWATVILSIPMVLLITAQSSTPPSHILNVGVGGVGSSVFSGAGAKFRPSAIFSFTNSVTTFFSFSSACWMALVYGTNFRSSGVNQKSQYKTLSKVQILFLFLGVLSLVIALPVSISRGLMANYGIVIITTILILIATQTRILSLVSGIILIYLLSIAALNVPLVKEAADAFALRWELAAQQESTVDAEGSSDAIGNIFKGRILGQYTAPIVYRDTYPILGRGIGMGSNIGAVRLSGDRGLLLGETSWGKQMGELGLLIGTIFIFWRISISYYLISVSFKQAYKHNNRVTLILASASLWGILNGQLGQASGLGFIVGTTGLTLASSVLDTQKE